MKLKISQDKDSIYADLSGAMDEKTEKALAKLYESDKTSHFNLSLKAIEQINSIGVRGFIKVIDRLRSHAQVAFENCPVLFIEYCNLLPKTLHTDCVHSMIIPVKCTECGKEFEPNVERSHFETSKNLSFKCVYCNGETEPTLDLENHIQFMEA